MSPLLSTFRLPFTLVPILVCFLPSPLQNSSSPRSQQLLGPHLTLTVPEGAAYPSDLAVIKGEFWASLSLVSSLRLLAALPFCLYHADTSLLDGSLKRFSTMLLGMEFSVTPNKLRAVELFILMTCLSLQAEPLYHCTGAGSETLSPQRDIPALEASSARRESGNALSSLHRISAQVSWGRGNSRTLDFPSLEESFHPTSGGWMRRGRPGPLACLSGTELLQNGPGDRKTPASLFWGQTTAPDWDLRRDGALGCSCLG